MKKGNLYLKISLYLVLLVFCLPSTYAQQINIPRVDEMPDFPQPFEMRDWKVVAQGYDGLIFDLEVTGQFLPLTTVVHNTTNYPDHPTLGIQSYIGTNSPPGMEAINVIPAVVGATLVGIDKSDQHGYNWPLMCEEYFNRRESENIYLNGPQTSSGHDWWYETMPNIFFYQLNDQYPHTGDFDYQFITIANRWLEAVKAMGGGDTPWQVPYMNYRAFALSTMTPLESGVKQPEAAGAIAWILYNAFIETGDENYRIGAEWCLEFLSTWEDNPSYEIQLPYGVYTAARMNAELGTVYDVEKMTNWCFDVGDLRGWGTITGPWGNIDVGGLIGEAQDWNDNYTFNMNSLEHLGALAPMVRYDDRFATAIGKWALNVANATRLYYSGFLPDDMQDNEEWTSQYDPGSVIAYEALREKSNGGYGTGDAMGGGWAQTNLGLYGSSHIGILGAIVDRTDVDGILQLDLLATDYYHTNAYETHLLYNPFEESKSVHIVLPAGNHDIWDAVSNQVIQTSVSNSTNITILSKSSVMTVFIPAGSEISYDLNKALVNGTVIDYNAGVNVPNYPPRIKSLAMADSVAVINSTILMYCTAEDRETGQLDYEWAIENDPYPGDETLEWNVPFEPDEYEIRCKVTDEGGMSDETTIIAKVVEKINYPPAIESITSDPRVIMIGETSQVTCLASDQNGDQISYTWQTQSGNITGSGQTITFHAPESQGVFYITCEVSDSEGAKDTDSLSVLVKDPGQGQTGDLVAKYDFDGTTWDNSGNGHNGSLSGCSFVEDFHLSPESAISFDYSLSQVLIPNDEALNFREGITLSFWININIFYNHEQYPVSHGNWQTRWKVSIGDQKLRFTINGENGIIDLDTETGLETGTWYHVIMLYNGTTCELYLNGEPDAFRPFEGSINTTVYDLIFGQSLPGQSGFNFSGILDNVRLYNYGISYEKVKEIYENEISNIIDQESFLETFNVFPQPAKDNLVVELKTQTDSELQISLYNFHGQMMKHIAISPDKNEKVRVSINVTDYVPGIYILRLTNGRKIISKKVVISN